MPDHIDPKRRYLCRHVHTDGRRCGSPALRAQNFCYYHDRTRLPNAPLAGRIGIFKMQPIDDRAAIQIALYDVLSRITAGDLDAKRASILLYGLQIASSNLARLENLQPATETIEDVTIDHTLGDLAPIQEIPTAEQQPPANPVILSEARSAQSKDPRISAPITLESAPLSAPSTSVILSEARTGSPASLLAGVGSAQSKDPRICTPTNSESTPITPPAPTSPPASITLAAVHTAATHSRTHSPTKENALAIAGASSHLFRCRTGTA